MTGDGPLEIKRDGTMEAETLTYGNDETSLEERKLFNEGMEDLFSEFQMK